MTRSIPNLAKTVAQMESEGKLSPIQPNDLQKKRNFTPAETLELQEMVRLVNARNWEAMQVKGNTALVPRGQEIAAEIEAIARLLDNAKNLWVARTLQQCGYPEGMKCSINLFTGEIVETNETGNNQETSGERS